MAILLSMVSCQKETPLEEPEEKIPVTTAIYPEQFDGAWVMSSRWSGYMGVAIAISKDRYYYWMYSDIPVISNYPYTGTFKVENQQLILEPPVVLATGAPADQQPEWGLYSNRWNIIRNHLTMSLHSANDKEDDVGRRLLPDFSFNPQDPFRNQGNLKNQSK